MIYQGISDGSIRPEDEPYLRWKIDEFQYTDKGITKSPAHGEHAVRRSWSRATDMLEERVKLLSEYASAFEQMAESFGKCDKLSHDLEVFTRKMIHRCLCDSGFEGVSIDLFITNFLKELRNEPLKHGAEVELQGIVLRPQKIEVDFGVELRQPRIEDLETEILPFGYLGRGPFVPNPSALLNVNFLGRYANEIQTRVEHAIAILRLFKIGSVRWDSYRMYSDSITDLAAHGTMMSEKTGTLETYLVTQEDVPKLRKFWQAISKSIPASFFELGSTKTDYLTVAYKRYSDALLQNGILERRIANAMMGLEALFLEGDGELVYRLSIRISKLFAVLGHNQYEVRDVLRDAYDVRSLFAHGSQLSYKDKKRLESKYRDVKNVLLSVLDYLRVSLIVMVLVNEEKEKFIDLLDDSLIDRKREEQLNRDISAAREIVEQ